MSRRQRGRGWKHPTVVPVVVMALASAALAALTTGAPVAAVLLAAVLANYAWSVSGARGRLARAVQGRSAPRRRKRRR